MKLSYNKIDWDAFPAWANRQRGEYTYIDGYSCPVATFLKKQKVKGFKLATSRAVWFEDGSRSLIPDYIADSVVGQPFDYKHLKLRLRRSLTIETN